MKVEGAREEELGKPADKGGVGSGGRLRLLDQVQSNERRLNAEIVCHFLGITQTHNLEDI